MRGNSSDCSEIPFSSDLSTSICFQIFLHGDIIKKTLSFTEVTHVRIISLTALINGGNPNVSKI